MATSAQARVQPQAPENIQLRWGILIPAAVAFGGYLIGFVVIALIALIGGQKVDLNIGRAVLSEPLIQLTISVARAADTQFFGVLLMVVQVIACFAAGVMIRNAAHLTVRERVMQIMMICTAATLIGIFLFGYRFYIPARDTYITYELFSLYNLIRFGLCVLAAIYAAAAGPAQLFLATPVTLYVIWIIIPMIATIFLSFTNWDGLKTPEWVGLSNYQLLYEDGNFWTALNNNVKWLLFFLAIPTTFGLALAMLFNGNFPGSRFFKIAFYSPLVLAGTVIGVIWEAMYRPQDGLINSFLGLFGVEGPGWLADRNMVLWCIVFAAAWRQVGYIMILYLAGLKGLDVTLIEASRVDGANGWERFLHVVFPLLGPVTVVVMVISVIDSLRAFDLVAIMTRGGPAYSSEVLANFMYMQAFNNYRMGYAGTIAVVILGLMLVFIIPYLARTARTELEY